MKHVTVSYSGCNFIKVLNMQEENKKQNKKPRSLNASLNMVLR